MSRRVAPGDPTHDLPYAHGVPVLSGRVRATPEDFVVEEDLGYQASGEGEHAFLTIRKRGRNTHEVARALAKLAGVAQVAVGYAGLKDRKAVTTQHFTVQLPGRAAPDWSQLQDDSLQILHSERHHRKIRRGGLRGNAFVIRVVQVRGDRRRAEQRLRRIATAGVPNYFGSQRFGREGSNLPRVADLFAGHGRRPGREQRGLLLSAARAQLFNLVLAGSQRQFMFDAADPTIVDRLRELDVHPTGPMCGRPSRSLQTAGEAQAVERRVLSDWPEWVAGLARFGLDADRRALRLAVSGLRWQWIEDSLQLAFGLAAGAYATSVLREVVRSDDQ